jgi:hypothetical protein
LRRLRRGLVLQLADLAVPPLAAIKVPAEAILMPPQKHSKAGPTAEFSKSVNSLAFFTR